MKILFVLIPPLNYMDGGVQHTTVKLGRFFQLNCNLEVEYYSFSNTGHQLNIDGKLFFSPEEGATSNPINLNHFYNFVVASKPKVVINQMPYSMPLTSILEKLKTVVDFRLLGCIRNSLFAFILNHKEIILKKFGVSHYPFLKLLLPSFIINAFHKIKHGSVLRRILTIHDKVILLTEANGKELFFLSGNLSQRKYW